MDFPCSYGEGDLDRNVTRSGIHVVTEKYEDFYMSNPAAGYSNVRERFAVRISNNGEFIHANPDSSARRATPTSPTAASTCRLDDAQQYFNTAIYGDPVEVTGHAIQLSYADGDIWDWAVRGTSGCRCRRCRTSRGRPRSRAPRRPRRRTRRSRSTSGPAASSLRR